MMDFPLVLIKQPSLEVDGYLGGEYPGGNTSKDGVPCPARILVTEPVAYGVVASTMTDAAGRWQILNLDSRRRYNVIARDLAEEYSDVVAVRVTPTSTAVVSLSGQFGPTEYFDGLDGFMTITSGLPPFSASAIDPLPSGLTPVINGRILRIGGDSVDVGTWLSTVRVTSRNGVTADIQLEIEIKYLRDPHWDKVVSLLLFDGSPGSAEFPDQTGKIWTPRGGATVSEDHLIFEKTSANLRWPAYLEIGSNQDFAFHGEDFTVEGWVLVGPPPGGGVENDRQIFGSFDFSPSTVFFLTNTNNAPALWDGSAQHTSSLGVATDEWAHFAFSRNSGVLRIFVNGQIGYTAAISTYFGFASRAFIGSNGGGNRFFNGAMGPFRVTKGVGRYTAPFTPPDKPFQKK